MTTQNLPPPIPLPAKKHSVPGIISFSIGCFFLLLALIALIVALESLKSLEKVLYVYLISLAFTRCIPFIAIAAGIVLAIVGLATKNKKKVFAILGLILNIVDLGFFILVSLLTLVWGLAG